MVSKPRTPSSKGNLPFPLSALFTPAEWVASLVLWEVESRSPGSGAESLESLSDCLLWGARRLTEMGYTMTGFGFRQHPDTGENRDLDIWTTESLGGRVALLGLGPVEMCRVAEEFLVGEEFGDESARDETVDRVRELKVEKEAEWSDARGMVVESPNAN